MEIALLKYGRTKQQIPDKENRTKQQEICSVQHEPFIPVRQSILQRIQNSCNPEDSVKTRMRLNAK